MHKLPQALLLAGRVVTAAMPIAAMAADEPSAERVPTKQAKPTGPDRVVDVESNSFLLHPAAIASAKPPAEGFAALGSLPVGKDADLIHSDNQSSGNFDFAQGLGRSAIGRAKVDGGNFVTLGRVEAIHRNQNTSYTRSILFGSAVPLSQTDVRAPSRA